MSPADDTATPYLALAEELLQGWRTLHDRQMRPTAEADVRSGDEAPRMRAYLLLNRWADNPLAHALEARFPDAAGARRPVVAERFEHRMDHATCVAPMPEELAPWSASDTLAAQAAREAFAQWLEWAWQESWSRTVKQHLGGVIFSTLRAAALAKHCSALSHQRSPIDGQARLIQYQDARILQRVWPLLTTEQRLAWLGDSVQWWSLAQPWGPWAPDDHAADAAAAPQARWFRAEEASQARTHSTGLNLFTSAQWRAMHTVAAANRIWAGYARHGVPAASQPDAATVDRLLADADRLGLSGANLEDYVYCTWWHDPARDGTRERPWHTPREAAALKRVLAQLRQQPDGRFISLYAQASKVD